MRPQAEEVSIFHLDVNQNDEDRFYDVTSEAIGTKDLLHFDVYRDEKETRHVIRLADIEWAGYRRAYFHNCMEYADCTITCQAMGSGIGRWIPKTRQSESGCCECMDPRAKHPDNKPTTPMCRNCKLTGQL